MAQARRSPRAALLLVQYLFVLIGLSLTSLTSHSAVPVALASIDFSAFPHGSAVLQNANTWSAQGWSQAVGHLGLLNPGAFVELAFQLSEVPSNAQLTLTHRSAYAPGCPSGGSAPIRVAVNGRTVVWDYAPPAERADDPYWDATDSWAIGSSLNRGANRVRITTGSLCSPYELRRLAIGVPAYVGPAIAAYQFTRGIRDSQPVDNVTSFSSTDRYAVLWVQVEDRAIGDWLEYAFYDPSGRVYSDGERRATRRNWMWIDVHGHRAASLPGLWRVEATIDGRLQLRAAFRIDDGVESNSAPRVTFVDMPAVIEANGEDHCGEVGFVDPDGDLSYAQFDVVEAWLFPDFGYAPEGVAGVTNGTFKLCVWTLLPQTVTLALTLRDEAGHTSAPYEFTFRAR